MPTPPPGMIQMGDYWIPEDVLYDQGVFTATPWTNGLVPYLFDGAVSATNRERMITAMAEIEALSGVDFVPRQAGDPNWILINNGSSNLSTAVGMAGGQQQIFISSWGTKYVLVHELMHALGHLHEQQRPDRNNYVTILTANINSTCGQSGTSSCAGNFTRVLTATPVGAYDFLSILHYPSNAFGIGGATTIQANPLWAAFQSQMGNRLFMTVTDAAGLAARYGAPTRPVITSIDQGFMLVGAGPVDITIRGTGFFEGSPNANGVQGTQVIVDGAGVYTQYVSPTELLARINPSLTQNPGCLEVRVENPSPGGGLSTTSEDFSIISLTPTPGTYYGLFAGNNLGYDVLTMGDADGDGFVDVVLGEPGYATGRGRAIAYSGESGLILWTYQAATAGERAGTCLATYSDVTGDGVREVMVGCPGYSGNRGRVRILNGATGAVIGTFTGGSANDDYGTSVAEAGDVDNNGTSDIVIGVPGRNNDTGQARVLSLNGTVVQVLDGQNAGDRFGTSVSGGFDLGGNGIPDIAVGAPFNDTNGTNAGRVYVYSGLSGSQLVARTGDGNEDRFGTDVAMIPALDGSSSGSLLVGAPEPGSFFGANTGAGYVRILGAWNGTYPILGTIPGEQVGDRFGQCVSYADDLNQDGYPDFVVGAYQAGTIAGGQGPGYVRAYSGIDQSLMYSRSGSSVSEYYGFAVTGGGDIDGDGAPDLLVGAPYNDSRCPNSGRARVLDVSTPPSFSKVMITEVSWGNPDGLEITNFGSLSEDISDWTVRWDDGTTKVSTPLGITIASRESVIVKEPSGSFGEAPATTQVLAIMPNLGTTSGDLTVALVTGSGVVIDEVRISDTSGDHAEGTVGGAFTGLAIRGPSSLGGSVERIWQLDSNSGRDWTEQTSTSMGLENLSSGPRGSDPRSLVNVILNELDDSLDYVELRNRSGVTQNLRGWFLGCSALQNQAVRFIRPFPTNRNIAAIGYCVIGDTATTPAEMPGYVPYVDLASIGGGNLPFTTSEYTCALYDRYGRLVDMVVSTGHDDTVVHNDPRTPSAWDDFLGFCQRQPIGDQAIGRAPVNIDTNTGTDWYPISTRTMGLANPVANQSGPAGTNDPLDVRLNATGVGTGLAIIINAGPAQAGNTFSFLFSNGHLQGTGPIFGLGQDSIDNYNQITQFAPWTGTLDAQGSARIDAPPGTLPTGIDLDTIFFTLTPQGNLTALTGILEYDS